MLHYRFAVSNQAARNINDAISLAQTAEGGLSALSALIIQRGRKLAVQAVNATNSKSDKAALQEEVTQIQNEISCVIQNASFNSIKLFEPAGITPGASTPLSEIEQRIVSNLQTAWLQQSETIINDYFGLAAGSNVTLKMVLEPNIAATAFVSFFDAPTNTMELHIDVGEFETLFAAYDGGNQAAFDAMDQVIDHEMTHAAMAATTNLEALPMWMMEGAAQFVPGADGAVKSVLDGLGGNNSTNRAAVISNIDSP